MGEGVISKAGNCWLCFLVFWWGRGDGRRRYSKAGKCWLVFENNLLPHSLSHTGVSSTNRHLLLRLLLETNQMFSLLPLKNVLVLGLLYIAAWSAPGFTLLLSLPSSTSFSHSGRCYLMESMENWGKLSFFIWMTVHQRPALYSWNEICTKWYALSTPHRNHFQVCTTSPLYSGSCVLWDH